MAVTKLTQKALAEGVSVTAITVGAADTIYANVSGEDTTIVNIIAYNKHTSAVDLYLLRTPDNSEAVGTPDADDIFYYKSIPAKGSVMLGPEDIKIQLNDTNDTLKAYASVTAVVNVWAFGWVQPSQ